LKKEKEDPSSSKDNDTISHTKHTKTKYDAQLNVNKKRVADKKIQKGNDKKRSLRRL